MLYEDLQLHYFEKFFAVSIMLVNITKALVFLNVNKINLWTKVIKI